MTCDAIAWVCEIKDVSPLEKFVLYVLADGAGEDGYCSADNGHIANTTCLDIEQVQAIKDSLMKRGLLFWSPAYMADFAEYKCVKHIDYRVKI